MPRTLSATKLTVPVPATISLGQGFVSVVVVNTDEVFVPQSNPGFALLQGSAAAGLPSITGLDGDPLAATSLDPDFAVANVETTLLQGSSVIINGNGFDTTHGVAVDVFCACPETGGKLKTQFLNAGNAGLKPDSITFTLPPTTPTGPGSIIVSNAAGGSYSAKSNAVSVPLGARINVTKVTQSGNTITVEGTGFSTLTVINLFNTQAGKTVNLGGLNPAREAKDSAYAGQFDRVHLHGAVGRGCGTGVYRGVQSAVPALYQQRQRPLRRVYACEVNPRAP